MEISRQRNWRLQEPTILDCAFRPQIASTSRGRKTRISVHEAFLRDCYRDAIEGQPWAVAEMLKIIKFNERARAKQKYRGPQFADVRESRGFYDANPALLLLGIAARLKDVSKSPHPAIRLRTH